MKTFMINNQNELDKFIKNFRYIQIKYYHKPIELKINYNCKNAEEINSLIIAHNIFNRHLRLEYVYDSSCSYLDKLYNENNYCEFINDQCIYQRKHDKCHNQLNGCCRNCKYLNHGCTIKALSDKLFFCYYIRKIKKCPKLNDILILKYFLNYKQKIIAITAIYHTREESIKALERKSLFLWCLTKRKKNILK